MFEVNFAQGSAREVYFTKNGYRRVNNYMLFIDGKGVHVLTRKGAVYLTPENARVL